MLVLPFNIPDNGGVAETIKGIVAKTGCTKEQAMFQILVYATEVTKPNEIIKDISIVDYHFDNDFNDK